MYQYAPERRCWFWKDAGAGCDYRAHAGCKRVAVVEANPLIVQAAAEVYSLPGVQIVIDTDRSYLRRTEQTFDVIVLTLTSSYHPVRSGAYSLAEDYRYTVEAFEDMLRVLKPDGLLMVARWEQWPPSESLRAFFVSGDCIRAFRT